MTFFAPDGSKINGKPIESTTSPKGDKRTPATVDSTKIPDNKPVARVEITIVRTTDGQSPKGVVLRIRACVKGTTGELSSTRAHMRHFAAVASQ